MPTPRSSIILLKDSFVKLFSGSLIITWPIGFGNAYDFASIGSDTGLSLFILGYKYWIGWEN
jgi:hypothetical protein